MATLPPPPPILGLIPAPLAQWFQLLWDSLRPLQASFDWDPASLADGAGETSAAVTVAGASFGDFVQVAAPYDLQGITCTGYVSGDNTVRVRLQNETGGAIDLVSGSWRVRLFKGA